MIKLKIENIAKKYLTGENEDIEFDSVRQAKELFYQIRYIYQKIKKNIVNKCRIINNILNLICFYW